MKPFFTIKNVATIGGVILSFVLPHIFFPEDEYEIIEIKQDPTEPETPVEEETPND